MLYFWKCYKVNRNGNSQISCYGSVLCWFCKTFKSFLAGLILFNRADGGPCHSNNAAIGSLTYMNLHHNTPTLLLAIVIATLPHDAEALWEQPVVTITTTPQVDDV